MFRVLSYALRALALYITAAIIIGTVVDQNLTWLHAVGFSAPTIGACGFIFLVLGLKPLPLDPAAVRKRSRVPALAGLGLLSFAAAYFVLAVDPDEWEEVHVLSAVHSLVSTYAGGWSLAGVLFIFGAMCLNGAFNTLTSRAIQW